MNDNAAKDRDEYLFSKKGPVDPEIAKLEGMLAPSGHDGRPLRRERSRWRWIEAVAAVIIIAVGITYFFPVNLGGRHGNRGGKGESTPTTSTSTTASSSSLALRCLTTGESLDEGNWIEAKEGECELELASVGRIHMMSGTRLQVRRLEAHETLLYLARGKIEATVSASARPRFFNVDTDAVRCVDLGCRYTLGVDEAGIAHVQVQTGRVAFAEGDREMYVPAGAECRARRGAGPGTPRFTDAPRALNTVFDAYDACTAGEAVKRRDFALAALAEVHTPRDTLPAWHLLQSDDSIIRGAAEETLAAIAGRPAGAVTAEPRPANGDAAPSAKDHALREAWKQHLEEKCW